MNDGQKHPNTMVNNSKRSWPTIMMRDQHTVMVKPRHVNQLTDTGFSAGFGSLWLATLPTTRAQCVYHIWCNMNVDVCTYLCMLNVYCFLTDFVVNLAYFFLLTTVLVHRGRLGNKSSVIRQGIKSERDHLGDAPGEKSESLPTWNETDFADSPLLGCTSPYIPTFFFDVTSFRRHSRPLSRPASGIPGHLDGVMRTTSTLR